MEAATTQLPSRCKEGKADIDSNLLQIRSNLKFNWKKEEEKEEADNEICPSVGDQLTVSSLIPHRADSPPLSHPGSIPKTCLFILTMRKQVKMRYLKLVVRISYKRNTTDANAMRVLRKCLSDEKRRNQIEFNIRAPCMISCTGEPRMQGYPPGVQG